VRFFTRPVWSDVALLPRFGLVIMMRSQPDGLAVNALSPRVSGPLSSALSGPCRLLRWNLSRLH